jgi:transcriptional regulator with XRE-family HTH domain
MLRTAITRSGMTQDEFAAVMGVSQSAVSLWLSGGVRPTGVKRQRLERLYGIPAKLWMTAAERREAFGSNKE